VNSISLVIPTRNAASSLGRCLASVAAQTRRPDEVIVVDGGSQDQTVALARAFGATVLEMEANRSAQRNQGARRSSGDYLLFIDADMVLTPRVIEECLDRSAQGFGALVIPETFVGTSFWGRVRGFERRFYDDAWWMQAARWYRREGFTSLGGFDTELIGPEDWDLDQRIRDRANVSSIEARILHQEGEVDLRTLLRKKGHYAGSLQRFAARHPQRANLCLRPGPRLRLFAKHPMQVVRHPVLAAGLIVLGVGELGTWQRHGSGKRAEDPERPWRASPQSGSATGVRTDLDKGSRPTVVALMNAFTEGMSGGDAWFIEVARRWTDIRLIVVTSGLGKDACTERGLNAEFVITTEEDHFRGVLRTYLRRLYKGLRIVAGLPKVAVVFSTSDAPPDVLPAMFLASRQKQALWLQRICHVVEPRPSRLLAWSVQALMHRVIRRRASVVMAISQTLEKQLIHRHFNPSRISVTLPGVDVPVRQPAAPLVLPTRSTTYDGLFVGRLHPAKGIFDLPAIWAEVVREYPTARLAIVGHGTRPVVRQLQSKIRAYGIDRSIDVLGYVPKQELESLYSLSRVFVFPSHEEGFGMAILDALARSIPVVTWNLPIYAEHFGNTISTVQTGDPKAFSRAIIRLLLDEAARAACEAASASLAASRSWDTVAATERRLLAVGEA
jgi:glycosyltransferase involved in cell wall biosynthesis